MSRLTPATPTTVREVELAIGHLRRARDLLAAAQCHNAVERVRSTLKSAEGALRHAHGRTSRALEVPVLTERA